MDGNRGGADWKELGLALSQLEHLKVLSLTSCDLWKKDVLAITDALAGKELKVRYAAS